MIPRYSHPAFLEHWSDGRRYAVWLEVELAACAAMEDEGTVPRGSADAVRAAAAGKLEPARIDEIERTTRHDVIAFLTHIEELAGPPARWLHLGMTSSDVLDTGLAILVRDALGLILGDVAKLREACRARARVANRVPASTRARR